MKSPLFGVELRAGSSWRDMVRSEPLTAEQYAAVIRENVNRPWTPPPPMLIDKATFDEWVADGFITPDGRFRTK